MLLVTDGAVKHMMEEEREHIYMINIIYHHVVLSVTILNLFIKTNLFISVMIVLKIVCCGLFELMVYCLMIC